MSSTKPLRKLSFYAVACVIPLLFFALLEGGLRLIGYGNDYPLFIENPAHPDYLLARPDIMGRYFPDPSKRPKVTLEANFFLKEKPSNGFRVFVQGGSTAAGFPYGHGASIAATLDQRLRASLPQHHVEVIGTALSAVNSYTLLDFADEIIAQSPDAVLIYAGHNEYLGVLGVGSNFAISENVNTTAWFIKLKHLRLFQLLQGLIVSFSSHTAISNDNTQTAGAQNTQTQSERARTLMSQVAKHKTIPKNSALFDAGVKQFKQNMQKLLRKYQDAGIPVFIATLASNQGQQRPFSSSKATPEEQALLSRVLDSASAVPSSAEGIPQWRAASSALTSARSADLHFDFATALLKQAHPALAPLAKKHFMLAIEHDELRFRAPQAINAAIEQLAQQDGVELVDSLSAFEARSSGGIINNHLMLEHLHPNLQGYYVLAESFYQSLQTFYRDKNDIKWQNIPIEQAWAQRLVLPSEEYYAYATIASLVADYPFSETKLPLRLSTPKNWQEELGRQFFEKRITWLQVIESSLKRYQAANQKEMAIKALNILADAMPHNSLYNLQLAEIRASQGRHAQALYYFQRAKRAGALGPNIDKQIARLQASLFR